MTGDDVFAVVDRIKQVARAQPEGEQTYIEVICPGADYWPLPWYLRQYDNVGWWDKVDFTVPSAPIILAHPKFEQDLISKFYQIPPPGQRFLYLPLFDNYTELRPGVEIRGYVSKGIWDILFTRSDTTVSGKP